MDLNRVTFCPAYREGLRLLESNELVCRGTRGYSGETFEICEGLQQGAAQISVPFTTIGLVSVCLYICKRRLHSILKMND